MAQTDEGQARRITVIALIIVLLLGALDQTIVSTAMPRIVAQLQGLELYAWVTTVYLLSSTVMVPIWGKLGDLYGRKIILMGACRSSSSGRPCAAWPASSAPCPCWAAA